jgi:uncharacterized membrane protein YgcG
MESYMKKQKVRRIAALILLAGMICGSLTAQNNMRYSVENVPNVQLTDSRLLVSDPHKVLPADDYFTLNAQLQELRDSMLVEATVIIIPGIVTEKYGSAKDFAGGLFNYWKLGDRSTNRGLLILLLTGEGEREVVFETGDGLESELSDGMCKLIQSKKMVPFFREENFSAGLIAGVDEVNKVLRGQSELREDTGSGLSAGSLKAPFIIWAVLGFVVLYFLENRQRKALAESDSPYKALAGIDRAKGIGCVAIVFFLPQFILMALFNRKRKAAIGCEKCHAENSVRLKGTPVIKQQALPGQDGMKEYTFVCSKCGHTHLELIPYTYVKPKAESSYSDSTTTYRSSSSSSRGSWGGGRSSGGGASTKF